MIDNLSLCRRSGLDASLMLASAARPQMTCSAISGGSGVSAAEGQPRHGASEATEASEGGLLPRMAQSWSSVLWPERHVQPRGARGDGVVHLSAATV